jgi:hypothetical protein
MDNISITRLGEKAYVMNIETIYWRILNLLLHPGNYVSIMPDISAFQGFLTWMQKFGNGF